MEKVISAPTESPAAMFAVGKLREALRAIRIDSRVVGPDGADRADVAIAIDAAHFLEGRHGELQPGGFHIERRPGQSAPDRWSLLAPDDAGAMYGALGMAEHVRNHGTLWARGGTETPRFPFRAIKFNLPWSPYRSGPATDLHVETCRDLRFWQRFLDMMAENRFNILTLWNLHPFTFMIRPRSFPEACPCSDLELEDWRGFWRSLFRMAHDRAVETYVVNWNIVVSPEFAAAHGAKELNDTSEIVRRYTRECVTQVIDEYPDLDGLGVTLADWMNGMTPKEREDWIADTFVAGMKAASRPAKFVHRSVLAGDPVEMRRVIDEADLPDPVWVEVKFNWSHGHSTPRLAITHDYESGAVDSRFWAPEPENYRIAWMIRNEDFFILRWGDPEFVREHIRQNGHAYVGGYFVGSEGCIPAADYSHSPGGHRTWDYAFEKQWLFYTVWGRLLYDPSMDDGVFLRAFEQRYGGQARSDLLLRAYSLASRMPLRLAAFHAATWDFTLYSEGFLAPAASRGLFDGVSSFISIDELIDHRTLDPTYLSIPELVALTREGKPSPAGMVSPLQLADVSERDGLEVLKLVSGIPLQPETAPGALACELDDLRAWAHLSIYFALKLRAGVALQTFRAGGPESGREKAVDLLERAAQEWDLLSEVTGSHYREVPYVNGETFSWGKFRDQVRRDIGLAANG